MVEIGATIAWMRAVFWNWSVTDVGDFFLLRRHAVLKRLVAFTGVAAARANMINVAGWAMEMADGAPALTIFVHELPDVRFEAYLRWALPLIYVRFARVGRFRFVKSVGSTISLNTGDSGRVGLFLKSSDEFALTCSHVLDTAGLGAAVRIDGEERGTLCHRIDLDRRSPIAHGGDPIEPNDVDCALARMSVTDNVNMLPGSALRVSALASPVEGSRVSLVAAAGFRDGLVKSVKADLKLFDDTHLSNVYFNDLTAVNGVSGIQPGDSGSLMVSVDNRQTAVGLLIGRSEGAAVTTDIPPVNLGVIAVMCDILRVKERLEARVGAELRLP